jgi:F-type H+-transporting ATPase subunit gamma
MNQRPETKRVGYLIVSTDRGLCGGLNSQLFRKILADMRDWQSKGAEVDVVCVGTKAATFFRRLKVDMSARSPTWATTRISTSWSARSR